MELLPLLLLIPMLWVGLVLFAFGLHGLLGVLVDDRQALAAKAGRGTWDVLLLLLGNGIALESLRPMMPANTATAPCVVLVVIGGVLATIVLARLQRGRHSRLV